MIRLHLAVKIVSPLILQRQQIEAHGLAAIDDFLGSKSRFGFILIKDEGLGADLEDFLHGN